MNRIATVRRPAWKVGSGRWRFSNAAYESGDYVTVVEFSVAAKSPAVEFRGRLPIAINQDVTTGATPEHAAGIFGEFVTGNGYSEERVAAIRSRLG